MKSKLPGGISFIGINGMGRIGRNLLRLLTEVQLHHSIKVVCDLMSKENLIYLLQYDSIRGGFPKKIIATSQGFEIDGHEIVYLEASDTLPFWKEFDVEIVVEATGHFTKSTEASQHLHNGAKHVLITTFSSDIPVTVRGVNAQRVNESTVLISPGDCTINAVAPVLKAIENTTRINSAHVNVIQGYTTRQELLDKPYKGFRRGRGAANSIIPFDVNIATILENIFPSLTGKIESMSTRVPIPCGAFADVSLVVEGPITSTQVNAIFEKEAGQDLKGITGITFDPIVSADILNNPHSGVVDGLLTRVTDHRHVRLMIWFDNEWGYVNRLKDWLQILR